MAAKILKSRACDEYHTTTLKLRTNLLCSFASLDEIRKITVKRSNFFCISSCFYIHSCEMSYFVRLENNLLVDSVTYFVVHALWL